MEQVYDMIIIGGGPGGYTAALYGARGGLQVLVLERLVAGGQMTLTEQIDNYPGFPEGIDGYTLGDRMRAGAERFGARTEYTEVQSVDLRGNPKAVTTDQGTYYGTTVVIATGAAPKRLELPGEEELVGKGVSYCASCDGMFYKGKTVVVVGGGNTAAAEALTLSRIAEKVILVHRRDTLRAAKLYHAALSRAENVEIRWNSRVKALLHDGTLTGVVLEDVNTGAETELSCEGLFVSIGRTPNTRLVEGQLPLDEGGYILAGENTLTDIDGVFAIGDVRTTPLRQIVTAVADGAVAAHEAQRYLA